MKNRKTKGRLRSFITWALWVLLVQLILVNLSAALYAHKLTHLQTAPADTTLHEVISRNIFAKTWRLFTGPTFYRQALSRVPDYNYSAIHFKTKNGISIEAWYSQADSASRGTVILVHGLTSNKGQVLDEATAFRNWGYDILLVDTRSHGNSEGNITSMGYLESEEIKLAYDHISAGSNKNIFLWGTSMGAVSIMKAISQYQLQPAGIIIEMPFLSLQTHLKGRARALGFPEQPFGMLTSFWIGAELGFNGWAFNSTRFAKNIHCPVLQQYGENDELVLKTETETIYDAIPSANKSLVMYDNGLHESFLRKDPAVWKSVVLNFLNQSSAFIF